MADPKDYQSIADAARFVLEDIWDVELTSDEIREVAASIERWSADVLLQTRVREARSIANGLMRTALASPEEDVIRAVLIIVADGLMRRADALNAGAK